MDLSQFAKQFPQKMKELNDYVTGKEIKDMLGVEAINHFKQSFLDEGFTDEKLEKWSEVERRKPETPWYGHSGQTGKFSQARTTAKILSGETRELANAFSYVRTQDGAKITNDKSYAAVHQFGLPAKIYGKKSFIMKPRPFVGKSVILINKIQDNIRKRFIEIIKQS
ncbi:MAG TPA: virion morphogenesis protein [Bacteroidales bacterium]|nr:virion morphogenesis protein [Bacteroidales bacterium]